MAHVLLLYMLVAIVSALLLHTFRETSPNAQLKRVYA